MLNIFRKTPPENQYGLHVSSTRINKEDKNRKWIENKQTIKETNPGVCYGKKTAIKYGSKTFNYWFSQLMSLLTKDFMIAAFSLNKLQEIYGCGLALTAFYGWVKFGYQV